MTDGKSARPPILDASTAMSKPASPLQNLLRSECGENIVAFLRNRGSHAHIVGPRWLQQMVVDGQPGSAAEATWTTNKQAISVTEDRFNVVAIAENALVERTLIDTLRRRRKSNTKLFGLFHHILPAQLCGANGMAPGQSLDGLTRYALVCTPRSGSRFLAALLSNAGVGAPKEHLREPLADAITKGKLGFRPAFMALERFGQRNRIFGTKLISTFLISASQRRMEVLEDNVSWLIDRGYRIIRLRRPLNEAVVSSYIAFLMRQWHFFGELDEETRAKLDTLTFEAGAAIDECVRFRADQFVIDAVVKPHDEPSVSYEEIQDSADGAVETICGLLGVQLSKLEKGQARVPLATRTESPTYQRFGEKLSELLESKRVEIEARTIARISAITGLARRGAESLLADAEAGAVETRSPQGL